MDFIQEILNEFGLSVTSAIIALLSLILITLRS